MKLHHARMRRIVISLAVSLTASCLGLRTTSAHAQTPQRPDVAVTFAGVAAAHAANTGNLFLYGGAVEVHAPLYRGLGVVANVTGVHKSSTNSALAPLDMVTVTFGPRYTWCPKFINQRISIYGQALIGEADGFHSVFATGSGPANAVNGTTDSANSFALQTGGGIDVRITRRMSVRVIEADYFRTQLPNGGDNSQNNLRLATGLKLRF